MVHTETVACIKKAELLLKDGSVDSMRYATLQLRMGIEYLFYELIPLYKEELAEDIASTKWQPNEIIKSIVECDPFADEDGRLVLTDLTQSGDISKNNAISKEIKAPSKRILKKHYHRLGGYLHAPVDLTLPNTTKWQADLEDAITSLQEFKSHQVLANVRSLVEIPCDCGHLIKRNRIGVEATGEIRCPKSNCKATYDVKIKGDEIHYSAREISFHCPSCHTQNFVRTHQVAEGVSLTCVECECCVIARYGFLLETSDGEMLPTRQVKSTISSNRS